MEYTIKTPSAAFNGKRGGVFFRNGVATTSDEKLVQAFKELGYEITQPTPEPIKKTVTRKKREE